MVDMKQLAAQFLDITVQDLDKLKERQVELSVADWNKYGIEEYYNKTDCNIVGLVYFNDNYRLDNLLHSLKYYKDMKVLDYGAGIGIVSSILAQRNTVYYYDLPSKTKEFATYMNDKCKNKFIVCDTPEIALQQDINCIVCVDVLEHVTNPMELVKEFTNKLHKDGLFLTTGLDFSSGDHIPMHLVKNREYYKEYTDYMHKYYRLIYYHPTKNETIYLWRKL